MVWAYHGDMFFAPIQSAPIQLDYLSRQGLSIKCQNVDLVQGSFFQYYEPGWSKGYYSSNWNEQTIKVERGITTVSFISADKKASGDITFEPIQGGFTAEYTFNWKGEKPVMVELSLGHLWAPAFAAGQINVGGKLARSPGTMLPAGNDPKTRMFGTASTEFSFNSPFANINVDIEGTTGYCFDARNYTSDWSNGRELFWLGAEGIIVNPGIPTKIKATWNIVSPEVRPSQKQIVKVDASKMSNAFCDNEGQLPLIPQPKSIEILGKDLTFSWANVVFDNSHKELNARLKAALGSRWSDLGKPIKSSNVVFSISNMKLPAGGYELSVEKNKLKIVGQDAEGLRNGVERAIQLTVSQRGRVGLCPVKIKDFPNVGWRAIHMFVGPEALKFQSKVMENLFAPLMINQMVLQCERANWKSIKGTELGWTMKTTELATLIERYRAHGIDVTPLIQSFGHMGWFFDNKQNLDLALNPNLPFAIDPTKPKSQEKLVQLWKEVIALTKPKIFHFGLDEVNLRGWGDDPEKVTKIWTQHAKFIGDFAKENNVEMMIWGDQLLGPGEAPDACQCPTIEHAQRRRDALPRETIIADWHYINNDNPAIYKSLSTFKKQGLRSVASTWNRPENIKGFFKAAELNGSGALQTTWAGYESNEKNMLSESSQFVAYLLAAEYSWSGRKERAANLPYDPYKAFRQFMYPIAKHSSPDAGTSLQWNPIAQKSIGDFGIMLNKPIELFNPINGAKNPGANEIEIKVSQLGISQLILGLSARYAQSEYSEIGKIRVIDSNGKSIIQSIRYGAHLRAPSDKRSPMVCAASEGISAFRIEIPKTMTGPFTLQIQNTGAAGGLALHGVTGI